MTAELILFLCLIGTVISGVTLLVRAPRADRSMVGIEITQPFGFDRSALMTTNLFGSLTGLLRKSAATWYIEAQVTAIDGWRFRWIVPKRYGQAARRLILAYWPQARLSFFELAAAQSSKTPIGHWSFLKPTPDPDQPPDWSESDPIAYMIAAASNIAAKEMVIYRIQLRRPTSLDGRRWLAFLSRTATSGLDCLASALNGHSPISVQKQKLPQAAAPVARVGVRMMVLGQNRGRRRRLQQSLLAAVSGAGLKPGLGSIRNGPGYRRWCFGQWSASATQMAAICHWPNSIATAPDNINWSLARTLPLPPQPPPAVSGRIPLGFNYHQGRTRPIYIGRDDRIRHTYIVGGTGTGKTTLLKGQIVADIAAGRGLALIDPHGDLAEEILEHIPKSRIDDLIYFDPDDLKMPIGINLLEIDPDLKGIELVRQKEWVVEAVVSVLVKVFNDTDDSFGHRIEYILRNSLQTVLEFDGVTLLDIFRLLNQPRFRAGLVRLIKDEDLKAFWQQEFDKAGDMQRVKMAAGVTAKIGRFLFSESFKSVFGQKQSGFDFSDLIGRSRILICNLAQGRIGPDSSQLMGAAILAKIQLAVMAQSRLAATDRTDFCLYVDEFQNFAGPSFAQMLSEGRKYRLLVTIAEQSSQQQLSDRLTEIILANVGTVVLFRSGSVTDSRRLSGRFQPFLTESELINLDAFCFYARIGSVKSRPPISGYVRPLEKSPDCLDPDIVRGYSRNRWGSRADS